MVTHPGAVAILALDDAQRVLMIRQYRHSVGRLLWEIPAGLRDTDGESPLQTAQRELLEETGYRASQWHTLLDYFSSPGYSTERIRIFLARGVEQAADNGYEREQEEKYIVADWVPLASGGTARAVGETAQRASYRRRAGWVRCQFRRVFWTSPRDRDRYIGAHRRGASRIEAQMRIGVPREVKNHEYRVAITPAGVHELAREGHEVFVETGAGAGSSLPDEEFTAAGAKVLKTADDVWGTADLVLKVKEPVPEEYHRMRQGQVLFTYLHLAASRECTDALLSHGVTAIAYETVQLRDGSLPLLAPMSEVAGRMAPQVGAHHLQRDGGGRGVLMGGVSGVYAAKVVVLGAGVSGMNAAAIALGMQAEVLLLDKNVARLRSADAIYQGHLQTVTSNSYEVERAVIDADLVIGAVLVPGAKAPRLVSHELVTRMKQGSVLVDISIDQGGCFEDSHPTTHAEPTYRVAGSVFYCVANMPGAVPHTSTYALTNVTLPYAVEIANRGWRDALRADAALGLGLNTYEGAVTCLPVAEAHDLPYTPVADVLGS